MIREVDQYYEDQEEPNKSCLLALRSYMLFVEGKYLDHPALETGKRTRMKIFRINPNKDLPIQTIEWLLRNALDLYRKGKIKTK